MVMMIMIIGNPTFVLKVILSLSLSSDPLRAGVCTAFAAGTYPNTLQSLYGNEATVINIGFSGRKVNPTDAEFIASLPDITVLTVMLGINDFFDQM